MSFTGILLFLFIRFTPPAFGQKIGFVDVDVVASASTSIESPYVNATSSNLIPANASGCLKFLDCEHQLMLLHRQCTERSRQAIAGRCGLAQEFKELEGLSAARLAQFGQCLLQREQNGTGLTQTIMAQCSVANLNVSSEGVQQQDSCWLALAELRKQCQSAQQCCASASGCIRWLASTKPSLALRRQYQMINRKTLQCRAKQNSQQLTRLHATKVDVKARNVEKRGKTKLSHQQKSIAAQAFAARLDYFEQLLRVLKQRVKPEAIPGWMTRLAARAGRPSQFLADHQSKGIFPASRRLQQERKAVAAVQQLVGRRQPQAFALPSSVDLQRMRLLAARPHLARSLATVEKRRRHLLKAMHNNDQLDSFGNAKTNGKGAKARGVKTMKGSVDQSTKGNDDAFTVPSSTTTVPVKRVDIISSGVPKAPITPFPSSPKPSNQQRMTSSTILPPFTFASTAQRVFPQIWTRPMPGRTTWPTTSAPQQALMQQQQLMPVLMATTPLAKSGEAAIVNSAHPGNGLSVWEDIDSADPIEAIDKETASAPSMPSIQEEVPTKRISTADMSLPFGIEEGLSNNDKQKPGKEQKRKKQPNSMAKPGQKLRHTGQTNPAKINPTQKRVEITLKSSRQRLAAQKDYRGIVLSAAVHAGVAKIQSPLKKLEIRRSPPKPGVANFSLPIQLRTGWAELEHLRLTLVRQLEKFVAKKEAAKNQQREQPLEMLGRSKQDSDRLRLGLDHCRLFSACQSQLRLLQSSACPAPTEGRLVPGPPRRRSGRCNARLLPLFERADAARAELEREAEQCLAKELAEGRQKTKPECPREWPLLPPMSPQLDCPERIALLHQHCRKLGRCCATLESCQRSIDDSGLARRVRLEEQLLAQRSARCQLQAQEMFKTIRERKKAALTMKRIEPTMESAELASRRRKMLRLL